MTEHSENGCAACQQLLAALLSGRLDTRQAQVAETHLQDCPNCSGQPGASRTLDARQRSMDTTLAAMQLDPCARAQQQALAFLANELPATARQLMAAHLATCPACTGLLGTLATLARQLPALAHQPVPAGFTQRVVAATSGRMHSANGSRTLAKPGRISPRGLQGLWRRPRFSAEVAYCCALGWSLVLGLPTLEAGLLQDAGLVLQDAELVLQDAGLVLRELGATRAQRFAESGELLAQGSDKGKRQLQDAQAQLQALYEQGAGRFRETIESIEPTYTELFR